MREDVEAWFKQALKDFESAKKNFKIKEYHLVAFLCQQAVEKGLKALFMHIHKKLPERTHSLIRLGKKVGNTQAVRKFSERTYSRIRGFSIPKRCLRSSLRNVR